MSILVVPIKKISLTVTLIVGGILLVSLFAGSTAHAATKSDWIAGNIITDANFTDKNAMSVNDIQAFLDAKIGTCDIWGTGQAVEYGTTLTRAQYAASRGWAGPPYTCLNKYYEVPKTEPSSSLPASNYSNPDSIPSGAKSAAWIIKDAAERYNISPKVLLVKIATESAGPLTSDNWPLFSQYRYAMGSHCPDSGPGGSANCDSSYAGFSIQIYSAAELLRWYLDNMDQSWWSYKKPYQTNSILWNVVQRGCGAGDVYIQNKATAALYTYTPYQPNNAALDNMYGTGDNCSAYGNRNFWRVFTDWFGSTRQQLVPLDNPRWLQIKNNTFKLDLASGLTFGPALTPGTQAYFPDKVFLYDQWYVRTLYDKTNNNNSAIPFNDFMEIPTSAITPIWVSIPSNTQKVDPTNGAKFENINGLAAAKVVDKITVNGSTFYRTAYESTLNRYRFIPADKTEDFTFYNFIQPRTMRTLRATKKIDVLTGQVMQDIPANTLFFFNKRITIDSVIYAQITSDNGTNYAISANDLGEVTTLSFEPMDHPRQLRINTPTQKVHLLTGEKFGPILEPNTVAFFPKKVWIDGRWYVRTQWDTDGGNLDAIPFDDLTEITPAEDNHDN